MSKKEPNKLKPHVFDDLKEYFSVYIQVLNAFVSEEYKLTFKEREFLVYCMLYQYNGGVLSDFSAMHDYFVNLKFCSIRQHVSTYKQKLSIKKWVKTGKYNFTLAPPLNIKKDSDISHIFCMKFEGQK